MIYLFLHYSLLNKNIAQVIVGSMGMRRMKIIFSNLLLNVLFPGSYKGVQDSDEDEVDAVNSKEAIDPKLKKEEEELSKIASGIGKVFLKEVQEREKIKMYKAAHLDPRNASR